MAKKNDKSNIVSGSENKNEKPAGAVQPQRLYDVSISILNKSDIILAKNKTRSEFDDMVREIASNGFTNEAGNEIEWWAPSSVLGVVARPVQ
jgi:hypothetical protein